MERLIAIVGPTAVGKTKVSIDLAKRLDTEIISGDSMLVYKGMDIGTAKPTIPERSGIVHHLVDILSPSDDFSVVDFQELAGKLITDINSRNKIPILAGGTGLYVKALIEGYNFNSTNEDLQLRNRLEKLAREFGNEHVHNMLFQVDPLNAERLHPNDLRRVIRALEVFYTSGRTLAQSKESQNDKLIYDALVLGLTMERKRLYERINQRVDQMICEGLIDEVSKLLNSGISEKSQAMQGIGYKEIVEYLNGETDLSTATSKIKQATRRFAKRQLTWYRKMKYIVWFNVDEFSCYDSLLESFYNYIAGKFYIK